MAVIFLPDLMGALKASYHLAVEKIRHYVAKNYENE